MKRPLRHLVLLLTMTIATPALAAGPGFDCARATRQIDKAICAWDTVGSLDGRMADAYRTAIAAQQGEAAIASVRADQKAWLAERDRRCALNTVKPREGSEEGLDPKELGQLICLQGIYPPRIARLTDIAAPPLVPIDVKAVPVAPLRAAYPDDWRQAGYQVQLSPDKTLMALGVEDDAGYVMQVWLYQPASGRLVVASPRTHKGAAEKPEDISALNSWFWGDDGRLYVRADRPRGVDGMFGADMNGYADARDPPPDVAEERAASDAARGTAVYNSQIPETERPPGFDDDSYNEQKGGAFTVWAQNKGHGSFDLMAARDGDAEPHVIASGGWELKDFRLDPSGTRLFHNGEDGLVVTDPATRVTRRVKGTRGGPAETGPINISADGDILVYRAGGACVSDAADEIDPDADDDHAGRVCLAYLEPAGGAPESGPIPETAPARADDIHADPWTGKWTGSGEGSLSATIRRDPARRGDLVIDLYTGGEGCSGAVTLYGRPAGKTVLARHHDPDAPDAPVCRVELSLDNGVLTTAVAGPCTDYHGGACGFDGSMTRSE